MPFEQETVRSQVLSVSVCSTASANISSAGNRILLFRSSTPWPNHPTDGAVGLRVVQGTVTLEIGDSLCRRHQCGEQSVNKTSAVFLIHKTLQFTRTKVATSITFV